VAKKPLRFKDFTSEEVENEALDMTQRLARGRMFKKNKAKIAMGRRRAERKIASMDTLKKRARKAARNVLLKKLTKDTPKGELSMSRRQDIEKRLEKKKGVIDKLSRKLLPQVRKKEMERKKGGNSAD
jgi:hypothetical protein